MKTVILSILLISALVGCEPSSANKEDTKKIGDYSIKVIDSCEYVEYSYAIGLSGAVYGITHKGNCKFCKQRNYKN